MKRVLIRELIERKEVEIKTGPFGTQLKASEYVNVGTPVLNVRNLGFATVSTEKLDMIGEETLARLSAHKLQKGDIVFGRKGAVERHAYISENEDGWMQGSDCIRLRVNSNRINARYLSYYFLTDSHRAFMISMCSHGTTMASLNQKIIELICVPLPKRKIQDRIVTILGAIDEKIKNNIEINDNLQQQLRTIFKAKFTNNPELEKMTQIPLSDLCHAVTKGTTPTTLGKSFVESGINFIKAESILNNHSIDKSKFAFIDEETNALLKRSVIHSGDIVFTIAGTLGRFALIDDNVLPANTNQAVAIIRADTKKILPEYIYTCFIGEWHTDYYAKRVQQAVQANLSLATIKSLPIPVLDKDAMGEYLQLILPIIRLLKGYEAQNESLAALRDSLLPKLMSGEIDVSDIDL